MIKLAIHGGKPIRSTALPYAKQHIDDKDCEEVVRVLKSDFLTTGPVAKQFEKEVAEFVDVKYAVSFSNGTAALHGACFVAGVGKGDEVITTPMTFAASANCALYVGAKPVFADINPDNFNIDVVDIERKITPKTKAIIPVDFTGQAVDIDEILKLAKPKGITVIQDAAHSLGTKYKNKFIGGLADMTEFSFHPVKTVTTGEGGMITTNSERLYKKLLDFRSHCITRDSEKFVDKTSGGWYYEQQDLGYNYRLTDIQSALGIGQMRKLPYFSIRRKEIVSRYRKAFEKLDTISLCKNEDYSDTVNHLFVIRLNLEKLSASRREIYDAYIAEGIGAHVHYIPVYLHPYYQKLGYKKGLCPKAEELYDCMLTLPLFPAMTDKDVDDVIAATEKIMKFYRK
jgi:UDP-4-amino-4,6-dideoxy-N-acetyl-beta-L-altrosamine transaminase